MYNPKINLLALGLLSFFLLFGCSSPAEDTENEPEVKVAVAVTTIQTGPLTEYLDFTGTSSFLNKSVIQSPTAAYVEDASINPGDQVKKGQWLLTLKTKEAAAFQLDSTNPLSFKGTFRIKAAFDGIVVSINHPKGDFVMEGEPLLSIALPESFVFLLEVPYEMNSAIQTGSRCIVNLSDGQELKAVVKSRLPVITGGSQTQKYIIRPDSPVSLPENLLAKVRIISKSTVQANLLPKSAILTDELMENFWVMKLINDSTAVRVDVKKGLSDEEHVEIKSPLFSASDRILVSGNYGLNDTTKVFVMKQINK